MEKISKITTKRTTPVLDKCVWEPSLLKKMGKNERGWLRARKRWWLSYRTSYSNGNWLQKNHITGNISTTVGKRWS